jgi:hypothetical protein
VYDIDGPGMSTGLYRERKSEASGMNFLADVQDFSHTRLHKNTAVLLWMTGQKT